jgi:hypothetical protein
MCFMAFLPIIIFVIISCRREKKKLLCFFNFLDVEKSTSTLCIVLNLYLIPYPRVTRMSAGYFGPAKPFKVSIFRAALLFFQRGQSA